MEEYISYEYVISTLKERFPVNNPLSWKKCSKRQLAAWYKSYIINNTHSVRWDRVQGYYVVEPLNGNGTKVKPHG